MEPSPPTLANGAEPHPLQQASESLAEMNVWLLESLGMLDTLLKLFQTELKLNQKPADIFPLAMPILKRVLPFEAAAFYTVNAADMQFELSGTGDATAEETVRSEVEHYIDEGTFGWALYQNHPVIVPATVAGKSVLFHVLATRNAVIGMFVGVLGESNPFIPDTVQKLLSIILLNCANVMESTALQSELKDYSQNLERAIAERTNELLKSKEEEQAANKAKSVFLANMSHEIRTPLSSIVGFTTLLEKTPLTEKQGEYVHALKVSSQALMALINDVLDFSKIEAGRMDIIESNIDLLNLCSDVLSIVRLKASQKGLALKLNFDANLGPFVRTDPVRLRQILINLIGNAEKFTEHGEVSLNAELVAKDGFGDRVRFLVKDTGIGIAPESLGKLFTSFTQLEHSSTRRFGGTGLGLSISNRLVKLLGGVGIRVESVPGRGSAFSFELKLARVKREGVPAASLPSPAPKAESAKPCADQPGLRLLVVDDVPLNIKLATEILSAAGYRVTSAENGEQALKILEKESFDAVLMDVQMPVMDGLEAARRIRRMKIKTPIIAVTANALEEDKKRCFKVGMNAYVTKPIDVTAIARAVKLACEGGGGLAVGAVSEWTWNHPDTYPVDLGAALPRVGNNRKLFKELMQYLVDEIPSYLEHLTQAVNSQNGEALKREAHKIKGAAAALNADAVKDVAYQLELKGQNKNFAQTKELLGEMETELGELKAYYLAFEP
jgi:signal transduction histidine kinase/CheY-like chemotaxis protein/HPt (histidine-containing phosphotransfer) domain-containing protein